MAIRFILRCLPAAVLASALAGCDLQADKIRRDSPHYVKPTVAVVNFQSSANPQGWNVGGGLADALTDELFKTGRFHVVERSNIGAVLGELRMQQSELTRPEGKPQAGRLKNVEYLVKGRVTDFGHVSSNEGWARLDWLNVFGQRYRAVLRMAFQVIEVESGRIVMSKTVECSVRADQVTGEAGYKNVAFGGSAFYRTPLGRVTAEAVRKAVPEIVAAIASEPWRPRIAVVQGDRIVINGGQDRGIARGSLYRVTDHGQAIIDPETGDRLARLPGEQIGQLEVVEVHDRYAVAKSLTQSAYQVGQALEPMK